MDHKLLLAKSITLLYQESKLIDKVENSADLVRTVLESIEVSEIGLGMNTTREEILALKTTVLEMCSNPLDHEYDRLSLLQRLRINCNEDDKLYTALEQGLQDDLSQEKIKKYALNTKAALNNHFKENQISEILHKASYMFKFQRDKVKNVNSFIENLLGQLEPLQLTTNAKDPAILDDIDIGDDISMSRAFNDIKQTNDGQKIYRTGWQALNDMLSGGFRQGECVCAAALPHNYKTGFTLSIFQHIALYNNPLTEDKTKKPLLLRISFEDDLESNLKFMYESLKYADTREPVRTKGLDHTEMASYVKNKLQVNGFHVKMVRVDPNQWTYKSICNKVIEFEAQGYNVEVLMLDYLSKVSLLGCTNMGVLGSDMCELFSRVRNFCASKKILMITPHQLSTEAKNLIRSGIPPAEFVKEVAGKGYYERSKSLDTVLDIELFIHKFTHNKESYFTVQRGKHRGAPIIGEEKKYFMLKFPLGHPIPPDIDTEDSSFSKIPSLNNSVADDFFGK